MNNKPLALILTFLSFTHLCAQENEGIIVGASYYVSNVKARLKECAFPTVDYYNAEGNFLDSRSFFQFHDPGDENIFLDEKAAKPKVKRCVHHVYRKRSSLLFFDKEKHEITRWEYNPSTREAIPHIPSSTPKPKCDSQESLRALLSEHIGLDSLFIIKTYV